MLTQAAYRKPPTERPWPQPFPTDALPHPRQLAGFPGAPRALPSSTAEVVPQDSNHSSWRWPGPGLREQAAVCPRCPGGGETGTSTGARWCWLAAGQSRRQGLGLALAVGSKGGRPSPPRCKGGTARLRPQPRAPNPALPRAAASTAQTHRPHSAPQRAAVFSGCAGGIRHRIWQTRDVPPAQRVTGEPKPWVLQQRPIRSSPARTLPPQRAGGSKARPGPRLQRRLDTETGQSSAAALPGAPAARGPLGRCPALRPPGGPRAEREGTEPLLAAGGWRNERGLPLLPSPGPGSALAGPKRSPGSGARAALPAPPAVTAGPASLPAPGAVPVAAEATEVPVPGGRSRRRCQRPRSARPGPLSARRHHVGPQRPHEAAADPVHGGRRARPQ